MDTAPVIPVMVARTASEEELGKLLDHMDEWQIEAEVGVEASHGEWIATLAMESADPRRAKMVAYLTENQTVWKIDEAPVATVSDAPPLAE